MILTSKLPVDFSRARAVGIELGVCLQIKASLASRAMKRSERLRIEPESAKPDGIGIEVLGFLCPHHGSPGCEKQKGQKPLVSESATRWEHALHCSEPEPCCHAARTRLPWRLGPSRFTRLRSPGITSWV